MSRSQELGVIKSGGIHYKQADIQDVSVKIIGTTAILLSRIRLVAVVGGSSGSSADPGRPFAAGY